MDTTNSLAHTKWECKYHIVFAPKYRRQVIYKDIKADVGQILGALCRRKGIEIIEAECCPDHIHISVSKEPASGGIVSCRHISVREHLVRFLLGEKRRLTIIVPGDSVRELAVSEVMEGGRRTKGRCRSIMWRAAMMPS